LPEKNFFNDNFELVLSEPSDANTNSTTLLSDETDDRPKGNTNQETGTSKQLEYEVMNQAPIWKIVAVQFFLFV
jgi:pseudo-response regulator 1